MGWHGKIDKHGSPIRAERIEPISAHTCLECGHLIADHHRAARWQDDVQKERDHCIGKGGTCPCRQFVQPHRFTRKTVA